MAQIQAISEKDVSKIRETRLKEMQQMRDRLRKGYERARVHLEATTLSGWDKPPAQIPRPGELAMGGFFDPDWNTR